jgi:type VI secretion system secreted protein VgrG
VPGGEVAKGYTNSFRCIPADATYRPERTTPKPLIHGAQTAVVVGTDGEDIHVDEFGRARVQFHWDRDGQANEKSSCWMRVMQPHVGGTIFLPRIGHEVVVTFLEGDPDQPIISGRVYNKDNMPPYKLPDFQTVTTIKTATEKGDGQGFNEIRLEDKKGEEQLFIHAEKNQDIRVKNDCFAWIGNERHLIV